MKFKLTKNEKAWVLYDVGNSAFVMFICSLLPIYYKTLAQAQGYTDTQITTIFSTLLSISAFAIALTNPVLGAIADNKGMKKKMFLAFMLAGVICCFLIGVSNYIPVLALIVILSRIGFSGSIVFYDSMLIDVTEDHRMDDVSSRGFAYGYIGSCIPFIMCLLVYVLATMPKDKPVIGIGEDKAIVIGMAITGLWWFLLSTPLLKNYTQNHGVDPVKHQIRNAFIKIGKTFKNLKSYKAAVLFVIAFSSTLTALPRLSG